MLKLSKNVWEGGVIPEDQANSTILPLLKMKGDRPFITCSSYRKVKLNEQAFKVFEKVAERRSRKVINIANNQFDLMPGKIDNRGNLYFFFFFLGESLKGSSRLLQR